MELTIRNFYLKNEKDNVFRLLGNFNETPYLHEPAGLGFSREIETIRVGNEDILYKNYLELEDITGELIFSSYQVYDLFINYISNANKLKLYSLTDDSDNEKWFYYVEVQKLEKGDKEENGLLICPITFKKLSNKKNEIIFDKTNEISSSEEIPTFPLPTIGSDFIKFSTSFTTDTSFEIFNSTNFRVPCLLIVEGEINNVYWKNLTNNDEGLYDIPIGGNQKLEVDANFPKKILLNGTNNYNIQDETKKNFLYLEPGVNKIYIRFTDQEFIVGLIKFKLIYELEKIS